MERTEEFLRPAGRIVHQSPRPTDAVPLRNPGTAPRLQLRFRPDSTPSVIHLPMTSRKESATSSLAIVNILA
jgi:hypothetical protein